MPKTLLTSKTCARCDKTFSPTRDDQAYCSVRCRRSAARKRAMAARPKVEVKIETVPTDARAYDLRAVRLNPSINPMLAAWANLNDYADRIVEYAKANLSADLLAKAELGREQIMDGYLALDEVSEAKSRQ